MIYKAPKSQKESGRISDVKSKSRVCEVSICVKFGQYNLLLIKRVSQFT